ncbi:3'(2'),5'-bisphosphate nucleotidase CysQ [Candidatus Sumerlaeota bacterium]|nr:3'(2'),5'-bisphosphate nucleotidase CysQ [Candidatus Sumerlaeota bacterium]
MESSPWKREWAAACDVARMAWRRIESYYGGSYRITEKRDGPATQADHEASETIVGELGRLFPDDGLLSEEAEDNLERLHRERVWVIDPIDGTNDFIDATGSFAIQIGLVVREKNSCRPVVGVVYQPIGDRMYSASRGEGAWVESPSEGRTRLRVSSVNRLEEMVTVATRSHRTPSIEKILDGLRPRDVVTMGGMGLKIARIAEGSAEYYVNDTRGRCKEWDLCAPEILLSEAGGKVTDLTGNGFHYNKSDVRLHEGILASNGVCHAELCERVRDIERSNNCDGSTSP